MTPQELVSTLDRWIETGGPFPDAELHGHRITTEEEVAAICRALEKGDLYATSSIKSPALHDLVALIQSAGGAECVAALRAGALPRLRAVLDAALGETSGGASDDWDASQRREAHLFLLKVLASFGEPEDAPRIVRAARAPHLRDGYLWSVVLGMLGRGHSSVLEVVEALKDPLPTGLAGVAYLDLANALAIDGRLSSHPFDTPEGTQALLDRLGEDDPEESFAISIVAAAPFLSDAAREAILASAETHRDPFVRLETAWARARSGDDGGRRRLAELCLDPRYARRAATYLEELGLADAVPEAARDPGHKAMAEMCDWLAHPNEMGRPPDEISIFDARTLHWPPTGDTRPLWLLAYRYDGEADDDSEAGIGLVGSVTFALFGEATSVLSAEEVYGLHCCWELALAGDPRAPRERRPEAGKALIAEGNPGFPAA